MTTFAVKKDSEGGVHPREVFRFVFLVCTVPTFRFAVGELRNSVRFANSITAFHFFAFFVVKILRRAKTPANQRVRGAFHVLKILGGFRRKRTPIDNFADFADFA